MRGIKIVVAIFAGGISAIGHAQGASWFPDLSARVQYVDASTRGESATSTYQPGNAGYVRLVVEPINIQASGYCPSTKADRDKILSEVNGAFRDFIKKESSWGLGVRIWQGATYVNGAAQKPDVERLPLQISRYARLKDCNAKTDASKFGTPLIRLAGMQPVTMQIVSWRKERADAEQLALLAKGAAGLMALAGVPAPIAAGMTGDTAQTAVLNKIQANQEPGHQDKFSVDDVSPKTGGGKIIHVYAGLAKRDMTTWQPTSSLDPRFTIYLETVGSFFGPKSSTYPDLSGKTYYDLLDLTRIGDQTLRALLQTHKESQSLYDKIRTAPDVSAFDSYCSIFRDTLIQKLGFSLIDANVVLYGLALENAPLNPPGAVPSSTVLAKSTCLRENATRMKNAVKIQLPEPVAPPPQLIAAQPTEIAVAVQTLGIIADLGAIVPPAIAAAALIEKPTFLDSETIVSDAEQQTFTDRSTAAEFIRLKFDKIGCPIIFEGLADASLWPIGFREVASDVASNTRLAGAFATTEAGTPVFLRFQIDSKPDKTVALVSRIEVRSSIPNAWKAAFTQRYPNGACTLAPV